MPRPNHRRPALRIGWVALPISLLLTTYACRAPTEMTVRITTEVPCSALRGVGIVVAPDSFAAEERARAKYFAAETNHCDSEVIVGTLVLTPGSDSLAVIVVAGIDRPSSACQPPDYAGCVVARRRLAFVEHTSLDVPVVITRDCLDVPCDTQTSCVHGNCKSSETSCDGDSCTQVASRADGGSGDEASADTGADTAPAEGGADADADADAGAATDAREGGTYDGSGFTCFSSPGCTGQSLPCSCGAQVRLTSNGQITSMQLTCPAVGPTCTCSIEGTFVKSLPNPGSCQTGTYGGCCSP